MAFPKYSRQKSNAGLRRGNCFCLLIYYRPESKAYHNVYEFFALICRISLGGTIGSGLFLSSGLAIATAGPGGALVAYICVGFIIYLVMDSLGEMATYMPVTGSFSTYASRFVDPAFGFALGWNYWYTWAVTVTAQLVAAGLVMQYWLPNVNPPICSISCLLSMVMMNMISVRCYGEVEYWLSIAKVTVILVFIFVSVLFVGGAVGDKAYGLDTWKKNTFHNGFSGFFSVILTAGFAFLGTELIGITAGESKTPRRDIPKAVSQILLRLAFFYILSIFAIGLIIPKDDENLLLAKKTTGVSPFTIVFNKMGIKNAAGAMNIVVLLTILSAGNSGLYAASRVLYTLSKEGKAPAFLSRVSKRGIPYFALLTSASVGIVTFSTSLIKHSSVYSWLLSFAAISIFISWIGISVAHIRFRRAYIAQGRYLEDLPYRSRIHPYGPWIAIIALIGITLAQGYAAYSPRGMDITALAAPYIGLFVFFGIFAIYKNVKCTKMVSLTEMDLDTGRQVYLVEHERELIKKEHKLQRLRVGTKWQRFKQTRLFRFLDWI